MVAQHTTSSIQNIGFDFFFALGVAYWAWMMLKLLAHRHVLREIDEHYRLLRKEASFYRRLGQWEMSELTQDVALDLLSMSPPSWVRLAWATEEELAREVERRRRSRRGKAVRHG